MITTSLARVASRADYPRNPYPLNDPDEVEALVYGFGVPPEPVLTQLQRLWWRLTQQGVRLPA